MAIRFFYDFTTRVHAFLQELMQTSFYVQLCYPNTVLQVKILCGKLYELLAATGIIKVKNVNWICIICKKTMPEVAIIKTL
jgi:hypothetical protein